MAVRRRAGRCCSPRRAPSGRPACGWWPATPSTQPPLDGLGPDADTVDADALAALLAAHPMRLHGFLRDQHILAGLGRRLANEICHRAKLSPFANTGKLTRRRASRAVAEAIQRVHQRVARLRAGPRPT